MADINGLQNELTRFHSSLPSETLLCEQSISRYVASPERPGYVFLHCHLAGCHIDLYRYFLPGQTEKIPLEIIRKLPREFLARSQKQAVAHSMSFGHFCDAIQNEVDQMRDKGKQELAADYSTIQVGTACVRVLLVAIQHQLFRDVSQETTAPLWRLGKVDEHHLRFLIKSVQRVTEPWCGLVNMAQQAVSPPLSSVVSSPPLICAPKYDHNKALVEEFDKSRKVLDQRCGDAAYQPRRDGDHRLPGTDSLLASIATGTMEDPMRNLTIDGSSADRWLRTPHLPTGATLQYPNGFGIEPGTPGVPLLLAQARTASTDPSEMSPMYDAENAMMGLTDLTGTLPDGNQLLSPNEMPLMQMNGSIDPAMYQQAPPGPSPGFALAQQGMFMDGYAGQFTNGHGDPNSYGQHPGYG